MFLEADAPLITYFIARHDPITKAQDLDVGT